MSKAVSTAAPAQKEPVMIADAATLAETPLQLSLIPPTRPEPVLVSYPLDLLPPDGALYGDPPPAGLVASVQQYGLLSPILLVSNGAEQAPTLAAGRRRVKAARVVGLTHVPALMFPEGSVPPAALCLSENAHRGRNTISDYMAVEELAARGYTVDEIVHQLHLNKGTVRHLLLLRRLIPPLRAALLAGKFRATTADEIARLPASQQELLLPLLAQDGTLATRTVRRVKYVQAQQGVATLPDDLFDTPDAEPGQGATAQLQHAPPWQLQASALLAQALDLVPSEQEALRAALARAAALVSA